MSRKASGDTHANIDSAPAPKLPHERDESSDSQRDGVRPIIRQAHDDLASGKVDTDRGVPMDEAYQRQKNNIKKSNRP
ncbi:MAG TPA: hypothetical protein VHQ87_10335 [Rhizobacter sp.]|nr:hypothetical protein [Rhizobacter sp.]